MIRGFVERERARAERAPSPALTRDVAGPRLWAHDPGTEYMTTLNHRRSSLNEKRGPMSTPTWPADGPLEIHSHSTVSDESFEPAAMAKMMAEQGVAHWALTDHDTTDGIKQAAAACAQHGVSFISGIEISAQSEGKSIHVLGYGFDPEEPKLESYAQKMEQARYDRMAEMVERMRGLRLKVTLDDVMAQSTEGNVGRPHLA